MTSEVEKILREYSWADDTELGEDKFIGHHDMGKAAQALTTYIDSVVEQVIGKEELPTPYIHKGFVYSPEFNPDVSAKNMKIMARNELRTDQRNRYKQMKGE